MFFLTEYLPVTRNTTGVNALPHGDKYYNFMVNFWTTTNKTPDEIFKIGLAEVKRISAEMEKIKSTVQFKGVLSSFFESMRTDKQFMPLSVFEKKMDDWVKKQHQ